MNSMEYVTGVPRVEGTGGFSMDTFSTETSKRSGTTIKRKVIQALSENDDTLIGKPGFEKEVILGENTKLKQLGIDTVEIYKMPNKEALVTFNSSHTDNEAYTHSSISFSKKAKIS